MLEEKDQTLIIPGSSRKDADAPPSTGREMELRDWTKMEPADWDHDCAGPIPKIDKEDLVAPAPDKRNQAMDEELPESGKMEVKYAQPKLQGPARMKFGESWMKIGLIYVMSLWLTLVGGDQSVAVTKMELFEWTKTGAPVISGYEKTLRMDLLMVTELQTYEVDLVDLELELKPTEGRLSTRHVLERGYTHIAICGCGFIILPWGWVIARCEFSCTKLKVRLGRKPKLKTEEENADEEALLENGKYSTG
jgi:hypothetical protein